MSRHLTTTTGTIREFFDLRRDWDRLLATSYANTVFLTHGWLRAWCETLGRDKKIIVPQVKQHGRLIGAAAFQEQDGIIEFAGKGPSDYADFVLSPDLEDGLAPAVLEKLLLAARNESKNFRHFLLSRIPESSKTLQYLSRRGSQLYSTVCPGVVAPTMEMDAAKEKLRKKSLRRHENGLARKGHLADATYSKARDILPLLEPFFEQHISRRSHTESPSLFLKETNREFYKKITEHLEETGSLRFTVLRLNDHMIAAHFGFLHAGRFIWYKPAFDPKLAKQSPGEVLLKRLIEQAQSEGALEFDFTIGGEAFKYRFATKNRRVVNLYVTDSFLLSTLKQMKLFVSKHLRK